MRWPNPIIVCTTALALVLAGCGADRIEATDLSVVTIENERAVIEKTLGKPDQVVEAQGFTAAAYTYEKGTHGAGLGVITFYWADRTLRGKEPLKRWRPKGRLAAVYDTGEKLVFVGSLAGAVPTSEWLASIVIRYKATQTGDADALFSLSKIAFIPEQQRTFLQTAAEKGSAEAQYRVSSLVTEDADKIGWLRKAAAQGYTPAYKQLGKAYQAGTGVERDLEQARVWFAKAAENGDEEAAEWTRKHSQ